MILLPANYPAWMPPLPEDKKDYIILGFGGQFERNGRFAGITCEQREAGWYFQPSLNGGPTSSHLLYAVPPNSEVVRLNLPTLPANTRILGWGETFPERNFPGFTTIPNEQEGWHHSPEWSGGANEMIYAIQEDQIEQPPATTQETAQTPTRMSLPSPSEAPFPIPEGYVYLGKGESFARRQRVFTGYFTSEVTTGWQFSGGMEGRDHDRHYCAPANSETVRANLPPLREGYEIIGYGADNFPLMLCTGIASYRMRDWASYNERRMNQTDVIYAVPAGTFTRPGVAPVAEPAPVMMTEAESAQEAQPPAVRQWDLIIGSDVVDTENIKSFIEQLIEDQSNLNELAVCLDNAVRSSNPEAVIEAWIDREPSFIAAIEFKPIASTQGVDIHAIAESNATISDVITKAAAGVMLRGGFSDHFRYLEDGTLTIDPSSPPTVDQAYELLRRTLEIKETASKLDNYSAWMLGMIADACETYFAERFDPSVIMAQTSRAYNTYICSLGTFRQWWTEKRNLSFTHHREVEYAKHLDHELGGKVLDFSEKFGLTVLQQRKLISYAKRFDIAQLEQDLQSEGVDDVDALMERIDIRAVNKRYIFFLRTTNRWYEYKGPFENIPNGASPIINADSRQIMGQDGRATKPEEWVPVGTIASPEVLAEVGADQEDEEDEDES